MNRWTDPDWWQLLVTCFGPILIIWILLGIDAWQRRKGR